MTYYLVTPGQTSDEITDHNILGEVQFKLFHAGVAWSTLNKLIEADKIKILNTLIIKDSNNNTHTIEGFLEKIEKLHIVKY